MTPLALLLILSNATAVDGDTFKHNKQNYRVWGIDAPERGDAGAKQATATLRGLIAGQTLSCDVIDTDRYQRPVVRCALPGGADLACALVGAGVAQDWPKYSDGYYAGCGE